MNLVTHLRRAVFDKHVDVASARGLEFGPHNQPMVSKAEGGVAYADFLTRDQHLTQTATELHDGIPETDYLLTSNNYPEQITEKFDYVVANHVIEHAPDMIRFLQNLSTLTKQDGIIFLAIPDKKFTFDRFRPNTSLAHVLHDYITEQKSPSLEHMIETGLYYDHSSVGGETNISNLTPANVESWASRQPHYGIHCHVFQSETILDSLIKPLCKLGFINVSIADFRRAEARWGGEMLLLLKNSAEATDLTTHDFYSTRFSVVY